jgi:hypothetical protein
MITSLKDNRISEVIPKCGHSVMSQDAIREELVSPLNSEIVNPGSPSVTRLNYEYRL